MPASSSIYCAELASDGRLMSMIDNALTEGETGAILEHLRDCSDCLLVLAKVLEMHGQMVVDHYWTEVRGIDPALT